MRSRIPAGHASRFIKWFNFNPVSMELRWLYSLRGGYNKCTREQWLAYLHTLDLVPVRGFLRILWGEMITRPRLAILRKLEKWGKWK